MGSLFSLLPLHGDGNLRVPVRLYTICFSSSFLPTSPSRGWKRKCTSILRNEANIFSPYFPFAGMETLRNARNRPTLPLLSDLLPLLGDGNRLTSSRSPGYLFFPTYFLFAGIEETKLKSPTA